MITKPYLAGSYFATLCIENQYFCVDSLELIIQIKGDEVFYIPNTLTPDGDEYNHYFEPISTAGCDPDNFQMEIYNRWGELVHQSLNSFKGWGGYFNGVISSVGTYTWKIIYKNPEIDEYKIITGHVNLIR